MEVRKKQKFIYSMAAVLLALTAYSYRSSSVDSNRCRQILLERTKSEDSNLVNLLDCDDYCHRYELVRMVEDEGAKLDNLKEVYGKIFQKCEGSLF